MSAEAAPPPPVPTGGLLTDQTVIVTGAGGGIGAVTAGLVAAAGARVALTDIDDAVLDPVAKRLRAQGFPVFSASLDAADRRAFQDFHRRVRVELGTVTGLVNCAGSWRTGDFADLGVDDWAAMLRANLETTVAGCLAVLPDMLERGAGSIVNFASTAGEYGSISPAAHYAAAKGGVIALTKSLAREVGAYQVRINAVSPGPTDTAALGAQTREDRATVNSRTLFGRLGRPEEIAGACVFLLSPLSTFVTGHVLRVNGGALIA